MSELVITKNLFKLLRLLADGNVHSGESIASELNISRGNVWHYINLIEKQDLLSQSILRIKSKGYQLSSPIHWLNQEKIKSLLNSDVHTRLKIQIEDQIDSSNTVLMNLITQDISYYHGNVLIAERQTAGRGRRGKTWIASLGGSLTFSMAWVFQKGASQLSGLSLVVGLAILKALQSFGINCQLKWPNDLLIDFQKLGGILIELQGDFSGPCCAVIGIGLNIFIPQDVKNQIDQPVIDIHSIKPISRNQLLAKILNQLVHDLECFEQSGFAFFKDEWLKYHAYQHQAVKIIQADGEQITYGEVIDIDDQGNLRIQTDQGIQAVFSGEVSLRKA